MNNTLLIKVFITDDHPAMVEGLKTILSKTKGFKVVGCGNSAVQMYNSLCEAKPHLLILDLNLPGSDFYANIKWVKDHAPWVKIVVYSEYHRPDLVRALFHEGISGFLSKSSTASEICESLQQINTGEAVVIEPTQPDQAATEEDLICDDFKKRLALSRREQEILSLISRGLSSQRIGKTLFISKHTVETHRKNILRKLDFNTSTELVKFAVQHGLV